MKTLLITRRLPTRVLEAARAVFDVTLREADEGVSVDEARAALAQYDAILPTLGDGFSAAAFDGDIRAGVLANFGVGYNHIDAAAAKKAGVRVSNTPDVLTDATADIGLTLILSTCRRAGEGERQLRAGKWEGFNPTGMLGRHVTGKTVGIVGMGRIGQAVARRCHYGFDMPVLYFNRSAKELAHPATRIDTLKGLMAAADIVVVTVPGGAETDKMINAAAFAAMKSDGIFINISRGDVVDEDALIDVLERRAIGGAGLDVYAREPSVPARLTALENCVLLPHLGSATLETREAMGMMALDNAIAWANGVKMPQEV